MKTLEESYASFAQALEEKGLMREEHLGFKEICTRLETDPAALDRMIYDELGYSGEEILGLWRTMMR